MSASSTGKAILSLWIGAAVSVPSAAVAQIVISEIMFDPAGRDAGREWVELYNAGASPVSIVGGTISGSWRITDGASHTFADPLSGVGRGALIIPDRGYVVVTKDPTSFLLAYPGGSFSVIKSSISLANTAGTIAIVDGDGNVLDRASYNKSSGGAGDGTSLQKTSRGVWVSAPPTPGADNASAAYASSTDPRSMQTAPPQPSPGAPMPHTPRPAAASTIVPSKSAAPRASALPAERSATQVAPSVSAKASATSTLAAPAAATSSGPWWYLSALALVAFGSIALYITRRKPEAWRIIEEEEE